MVLSLTTMSVGLLACQLLFSSSVIALATGIVSGLRASTVYVYRWIHPEEKREFIKDPSYQVITTEEIDRLDPEIREKLTAQYGDNFLLITNQIVK